MEMSTDAAFAWFDTLAPVTVDEMLGEWLGHSVATGHPMDARLQATGWVSKRFDSADDVHPLICRGLLGGTYAANPGLLPLRLGQHLPVGLIRVVFPLLQPLIRTSRPTARLRMTTYRGQSSATMIYDSKPIIDVFRRIDTTTLLGIMDQRSAPAPLFFKLTRPT